MIEEKTIKNNEYEENKEEYDIFGLGSPLLDAIVKVDETHLLDMNLKKGSMHLIDSEKIDKTIEQLEKKQITFIPGGDIVNTVRGVVNLGGKGIFCGKVGVDKHGLMIEQKLINDGVKASLVKGKTGTGTCISLVTPDFERTFLTNLGAAITIEEKELLAEDIKRSKIVYLSGYILEAANLRATAIKALNEAKRLGKLVAIDLADPSLVTRCKEDLKEIVMDYADILFANESEAEAFTGLPPIQATEELGKYAQIAIVKIGKEGSLLNVRGKIETIKGFKANAVDTTGAGDMFAAGFIYGITHNKTEKEAAIIGSYVVSKIVEELGGRLSNKIDVEKISLTQE